ncbi:flagellar hook-associated protein 2 [Metabacillus sediminilitoris]|uniref:Flagellar hook-associated protein 2 n=1 Tax=Metabacillus sediminilitoris TaxID=2567941 RepID=A0A4S4C1N9_9BACI|nr:flagellar hook-associated protein 2 [Metabacillus sediminilitoris]QGQ48132.1 flagellar hook-associated protein 2 [Metabacillus sediminilitoris]THF81505.1 flagellar hook-associated protein 2 [Metabacillus sediminilitoris]
MAGIRIGGLASGMDIDTIVSDLMKAERIPLDKLTQKKQTVEWQRDDYRDMNKLLKELDDMLFINDNSIGREATFLKKSVSSSDDSKVSAKAINAQTNISSTIDVLSLANSSTWKTSGNINYTAQDIELKFKVKDPGATEYRYSSIKLSASDSIDNVISKINSSTLGVTAMKEKIKISDTEYKDTIVFTNNKTGAGVEIALDDRDAASETATQTFMSSLGFTWGGATGKTLVADQNGVDATIKVNGYEMQKSSNTFTLNGIEYTAKGVTSSSVSISSSTDVDSILDSVVKFVNKYNEVIDKINGKLSEERYRDYQPLTDEQKSDMEDKTIELWEEKAKSGLLKNDSILSSGLNSMRMDFYAPVKNSTNPVGFQQLAEIGIKTSSNYLDKGKLIIDETKLREKIQENPSAIYQLFNADGGTEETTGIAKRLRETIKDTISNIEEKAGNSLKVNNQYTLGRNLNSIENQIDRFEDRLTQVEDRYWRQFTAMEKAIQQSNSQMSYLMSQFSS